MANIDNLNITVTSDVTKAINSLSSLSRSLTNVANSLRQVNTSGFDNLSRGIDSLSRSMKSYAESTVKTQDFTRLAKQIDSLANTNSQGLFNMSSAISKFAKSVSGIGDISNGATQIGELAKGVSKLGNKGVENAVKNIPLLAKAMRQLMTELSKSPKVSRNIVDMTNALANLTSTVNRTKTATTGASKGLDLFSSSSVKATSSSKGLASAIGKVYATYWLLFRAFSVFGKAVNYASSLTEVQNVVEQTFGQSTKAFNEFSASAKNTLGMSELVAKQIGSRYQAMGSAMDISSKQMIKADERVSKVTKDYNVATKSVAGMSTTLTKLAGDMASFYDTDQLDVAKDLEAVYTGMTRPLRKYGLDLTEATLKEYALKNGMDADIKSMSQAEKTMLRYQYVLENTKKAQNDFLRTADSWANQVKLMKQNFISLGTTIGQVFINAFKPMLKTLNNVLVAVNNFAIKIANALGNIFGWVYEGNDVGILADTEEDASSLADDLGQADKNAKKLKNTIMGYDELNVMQAPNDDDKGGSGSGADVGGGAKDLDDSKMGHWVKKYQSEIDNLFDLGRSIADKLEEMMAGIDWKPIYEKARNFGKGLAEFLNGLFKPSMFYQLGRTIAGCLNTAINFVFGLGKELDFKQIGEAISSAINGFFDEFDFKLLADTIDIWVQGIWEAIKTAFLDPENGVNWDKVLVGLNDFFSNLDIETVEIIVSALVIKKVGKVLIGSAVKGYLLEQLGNFLKAVFSLEGLKIAISLNPENFVFIFSEIVDSLTGTIFDPSTWENMKNPLVSAIGSLWNGLSKALWGIADGIEYVFNAIGNYITSTISYQLKVKIAQAWIKVFENTFKWDFTKSIFADAKKHFEQGGKYIVLGILEGISGAITFLVEPIINIFKGVWNTLCDVFGIHSPAEAMKPIGEFILLGIVEGFKSKVSEFTVAITNWFNESVRPWFTTEKWNELWTTVKNSFVTKWNEIVAWWRSNGVVKWYEENVKPWFSQDKWNFSGIKDGLVQAFENAVKGMKVVYNKFAEWINEKLKITWDSKSIMGKEVIPAGSIQLGKLPTFATGGFPEDGLFMANHGEMVGKFSNGQNVVANNQQITEGIRQAVVDGMMNVIMATSNNKESGNITLTLDGRVIAQSTYDNFKTMSRQGIIPQFV